MRDRSPRRLCALTLALVAALGLAQCAPAADAPIVFEDVTEQMDLLPHLQPWRLGHAGSWGDMDGDGRPDLFIAPMAEAPRWTDGPIPNLLFLNRGDRFELSPETNIRMDRKHARAAHALMADLDNDGDLDLLLACHAATPKKTPSVLWENLGGARFRDATPDRGYWPSPFAFRNVGVYDFDADGLLDLVACDGDYRHWRTGGGRLEVFRNRGDLTFEDASERFGFPQDHTVGMGLAIGDLNNDGHFDFFVADGNRLFVSRPDGTVREAQPGYFVKPTTPDSHTCGAVFGDLNGDDLLDMVTAIHGEPSRIHVYINRGTKDGLPTLEDVSVRLGVHHFLPRKGITNVTIKLGQLALVDVDNDGRKDILLGLTHQNHAGDIQPVVLRNTGNRDDGLPALTKLPLDRLVNYYATAPVGDYDRDGRVDIFTVGWFGQDKDPSSLYRNVTEGGRWLRVTVAGKGRFNPMGVGAVVKAYAAGRAGDPAHLIQRHDIAVGTGYSSGEEALAHLGLGDAKTVDVVVTWLDKTVTMKNVRTNQGITVRMER